MEALAEKNLLNLMQLKYGIIGSSKPMREVIAKLVQAAPTDLSILITGETGTGKEVFANAIHGLSNRSKFPFLSVNCGAIPETLLESELFGNERGAFTGASEQRKGYFEVADKGTIFLDEIGEMPFGTQVKLLRVLESGEFMRLGSTDSRKVNVRIIAATNRELESEVKMGNFRQDLLFRLNSVQIALPSLREHSEDIPLLVDFFAKKTASKLGMKYDGIAREAILMLQGLSWPGNIRELKNMIETLITLEQATFITPELLKRYLPLALPAADYEAMHQTALVPLQSIPEQKTLELELIFRTLLELKHDINDVKNMLFTVQRDIETIKADVLDIHPESGHQIWTEDIPHLSSDNLDINQIERQLIEFALKKYMGNRRSAAGALGISERTLYRKISEFGLE